MLGPYGGSTAKCRMTAFLINGITSLDAGALSTSLTVREQYRVRHVVITHSHFDHVVALPFLLENTFGRKTPVEILAPANVLTPLKRHLFNDALWPDFSRLPSRRHATMKFRTIAEGRDHSVDGVSFMPIAVKHSVPSYGYLISNGHSSILFSGDTAPTRRLWEVADATENLRAIFLEVSFANELSAVARASKHLTPSLLEAELAKTRQSVPVYLYHMKPPSARAIRREVRALKNPRFHFLSVGQRLTF